MRQLLLWICISLMPALAFSQTNEAVLSELTVYFDNNKFDIRSSENQKIDVLLQSLAQPYTSYAVEISAFTDSNGSEEFNKLLSYKRAKSLADYLVKNGFAAQKISFIAQGESNPVAGNDSETGRAENRRASFKITQNRNFKNAVSGLTIKEELFPIDAQNPSIIKYSSGTELTIPENAFVDKNGNPVTGNVDINYIEYRNPVDFILGNIPMNYKQNGQDYFFNSAGMFKIGATKDNEEVFLDPKKQISIDFKLTENLPDLNFYKFDETKNVWVKDSLTVFKNEPQSANLDSFLDFGYKPLEEEDSTQSNARTKTYSNNLKNVEPTFNCASVAYNLKLGKALISSNDSLYDKTLSVPMKLKVNNIKKQKSVEYQRTVTEKAKRALLDEQRTYLIKCNLSDGEEQGKKQLKISPQSNSYINKLDEISWIVPNAETTDLKTATLVSIHRKAENLYTVVLKDSVKERKLEGLSVANFNQQKGMVLNNIINQVRNRKIQLSRVDNLIAGKNKILETKKKQLVNLKKVRYTTEDTIKKYRKLIDNFWEFNKEFMTKEEQALTANDWTKYFDEHKTEMAARYKTIEQKQEYQDCLAKAREIERANKNQQMIARTDLIARQKLNISSLGIYNCDQIQRLQNPMIVNVEYQNAKGEKVFPVYIYIIDKKINGVLRYDGYGNYDPFHFAFSPSSKTTLLALDANGNAYICNPQKINELRNRSTIQKLTLTKIENIDNREQLASLLN